MAEDFLSSEWLAIRKVLLMENHKDFGVTTKTIVLRDNQTSIEKQLNLNTL